MKHDMLTQSKCSYFVYTSPLDKLLNMALLYTNTILWSKKGRASDVMKAAFSAPTSFFFMCTGRSTFAALLSCARETSLTK